MNGPWLEGMLIAFPFLWIGGLIAASVAYRLSADKPIFPRVPKNSPFKERAASGWNDGSVLGRLGGANNCLLVVVTDRALIVSPFFPFNLMFLPELLGLELSVPLSNIRRVEVRRRLLRSSLIVETSDGRRIGLHLREPEAFQAALKRTGSASRS